MQIIYSFMLITFALGSLAGATSLSFLTSLPSNKLFGVIFCLGLFISLGGVWWANKTARSATFWVFVLGISLGFGWAFFQASKRLSWQLPLEEMQKPIEMVGKVVGITQAQQQGVRFDVVLQSYQGKKLSQRYPVKIRLFWAHPQCKLWDGDVIAGTVKLKIPWHLANPGGFDQEKQLFIEGIRATGQVLHLDNHQPGKSYSVTRFRQQISEKMDHLLEEKPLLGVIQAMTLGISAGITPSQWQTFQGTGTIHMVAISGQQVALVAMLCFYLVAFLVRRSSKLTSLYPDKYYGAIAAMLGAVAYSALAGFSIPTQRSLIMIIIGMLALLNGQPVFTWTRLAYAWLVIALIDPLAPMQLGFWLSFGCVAALIYGRHHYTGKKWREWVFPQWIVFIALLPVSVVFFHQTALYSPLANMIALPVISFIVVPLSFLAITLLPIWGGLANLILEGAHFSLASVWIILEKITHLPFNIVHLGEASLLTLFVGGVGALLLLAPKGIPGRHFGWLALLPIFVQSSHFIGYGDCRLTLLDVGQGLSAVVQTQHHTLLYDAGPEYGKFSDAGVRVIKPFLTANHITFLDKIVISHSDLDHRGGLKGLLDVSRGEVLTSEPNRLSLPAKQCMAGQTFEWDGVTFKVLGPLSLDIKKRNDLSCVLKISTASHSILLSGDIEKIGEKKLAAAFKEELKSGILVVPHHGSKTSSTEEFIAQVAPTYALYPVGMGNHYGFPKEEVLARYEKNGSQNLVSWRTGAITFEVPATGELKPPSCYRRVSQRFWFNHEISK